MTLPKLSMLATSSGFACASDLRLNGNVVRATDLPCFQHDESLNQTKVFQQNFL